MKQNIEMQTQLNKHFSTTGWILLYFCLYSYLDDRSGMLSIICLYLKSSLSETSFMKKSFNLFNWNIFMLLSLLPFHSPSPPKYPSSKLFQVHPYTQVDNIFPEIIIISSSSIFYEYVYIYVFV